MYLKKFEYLSPQSISETLELLSEHEGHAKLLAGGTDLIVNINRKKDSPKYIISLKNLNKELRYIRESGKGVEIGCLTTHNDLEENSIICEKYTALAESASVIGSPQVRKVGTVGGNICSALPSADTASPLIAFGADITILSSGCDRVLPLEKFFTGPGESVLKDGELLKSINLKTVTKNTGSSYIKFGRRNAMEIALSGVAVYVEYDPKIGKCIEIRLVLTSSGPKPWRCIGAENYLRGAVVTKEAILETAEQASLEAKPRSSYRSTEGYRRHLLVTLCVEALDKAFARAGGLF